MKHLFVTYISRQMISHLPSVAQIDVLFCEAVVDC